MPVVDKIMTSMNRVVPETQHTAECRAYKIMIELPIKFIYFVFLSRQILGWGGGKDHIALVIPSIKSNMKVSIRFLTAIFNKSYAQS